MLFQDCGIDEELHAQVKIDFGFALGLGEAAHCVDVVRFNTIEVVFSLGVLHAEDGVRVGFTVDVGDTPVVADDGDVAGLSLPARNFPIIDRVQPRDGRGHEDENENEILQATAFLHELLFSIHQITVPFSLLTLQGRHGGCEQFTCPRSEVAWGESFRVRRGNRLDTIGIHL